MTRHTRRWSLAKPNTALQEIFSLKLGISKVVAQVLINRGITTIEQAKAFLNPDMQLLHNPLLMKDMSDAVNRIIQAVNSGEKIRVFGDYDVDGITSTTIMMRVLKAMGGNVDYYIPGRLTEGYGLNMGAIKRAYSDGVSLIITVDSGISARDEVAYAGELGINIIITDHHEPPDEIPDAAAVINPKQKDCQYPFKDLAGAGVAFKLGQALLDTKCITWPEDMLELACLGTIADIVPLKGENRILVKNGLKSISHTNSIGLKALIDECGLSGCEPDARQVAFQVAPKINAAGRIADAALGVKLLLSENYQQASSLASELHRLNDERQAIEASIYLEAVKLIEQGGVTPKERVIVLAGTDWHLGVIGIVASKLVKDYFRPVVLLSIDGDTAKGSARSIPSFNIYEALKSADTCLQKYGGHSQAAGLTLFSDKIEELKNKLNSYAEANLKDEDLLPELSVDTIVDFNLINDSFFRQLQMLAPFGSENPYPALACQNASIVEHRAVGADRTHLKMRVSEKRCIFDAIGFNLACMQELFKSSESYDFDIVFSVEKNEWKGRSTLQLNVQDIKPSACSVPVLNEPERDHFIENLFRNAITYLADDFYRNIADKDEFYTKVVGVTFENRQEIISSMYEGQPLKLLREPNNEYDPNAVKVITGSGLQVGYLNAKLAKHFSPLLERGEEYQALVSQITGGKDRNYGVNIVIQKLLIGNSKAQRQALSALRDELSVLPDEILMERIREVFLGGNPYRPKQQESLQHLAGGFNTLAIFGTGRGKSAVFQTMAAFKALRYNQLTVIIYPLRALVNDQFENMSVRLERLGLRVFKGNGSISDMERANLFEAIEKNEIDILLTTPEFVTHHIKKITNMKIETGLFVVDESHHIGISTQSHRPIYKRLGEIAASLGNPVTLAVTATANDEVANEIIDTLNIDKVVIDPHIRQNLRLIDRRDYPDKNRYLKQVVNSGAKTIIYVNSRLQTVELAAMLREELAHLADNIVFYHAGLSTEQRNTIEKMFRNGEVCTVVSTSAFGEGIDIPDIKHVVIYHLNFSFTEFNQQCGRCGRDGREAEIHLICTKRDAGINQFILETSSPDRDTLAQLYLTLKEQSFKSTPITLTNDEIAKLLKAAGMRFARPNLVSVGVGIFEELGLLHREVMGRNRQIYLASIEGKINLEQSLRFLEGQEEITQFKNFEQYFFEASSDELLSLINRPIYPNKYYQEETGVDQKLG